MYTLENYHWGLVAYYLGALLMMVPVWRMTRFIPWFPLRWLFRVIVIAALGTPMIVFRDMEFLAPAWGIAVFELIYPQTGEGWQRGLQPMIAVACLLYALVLGVWLLILRRRRRRAVAESQPESSRTEPTLAAMMVKGDRPELDPDPANRAG